MQSRQNIIQTQEQQNPETLKFFNLWNIYFGIGHQVGRSQQGVIYWAAVLETRSPSSLSCAKPQGAQAQFDILSNITTILYDILSLYFGRAASETRFPPNIPLSAKPQGVGGQDWNQWTDGSIYNMLERLLCSSVEKYICEHWSKRLYLMFLLNF